MHAPDRRDFLRLGMLGLAGLAACTREDLAVDPTDSPSPTIASTPPPEPTLPAPKRWERIDAAGPGPRRDHSLTALGPHLFLFGGRDAAGERFDDFWEFDVSDGTWRQILAPGPSKRLGHGAAAVGGELLVFGGQDGSTFFNDLWAFDPDTEQWRRLSNERGPEVRYGGGAATVGGRMFVTHGFRFGGRFDDTWVWTGRRWRDRSPGGERPVKRCLIATPYLAPADSLVLFGGQTDGTPFLGDTWLYDVGTGRWTEVAAAGPSPRNVYAAGATRTAVTLFGGETGDGASDELWSFDGRDWEDVTPEGRGPDARGGVAGTVHQNSLYVFGGRDGSTFFDDLWRIPV